MKHIVLNNFCTDMLQRLSRIANKLLGLKIIVRRSKKFVYLLLECGLLTTWRYISSRGKYYLLRRQKCGSVSHIVHKKCNHPFYLDFNSSDREVFDAVFFDAVYACFYNNLDVKLVVDCGSNIGLSSIWFLNRYERTHVIAVEPDPRNFVICKKNLAPYNKRVTLINRAVWPIKTNLVIEYGHRYDATQVKERARDEKSEHSIKTIDVFSLLKCSGFEMIDILKIDIEKSEKELFSKNVDCWLGKTKNLCIELHDNDCRDIFFKALKKYNYIPSSSGELVVCSNITPKT